MIKAYRLENKNKISVTILNIGAIIHEINVPDRNGKFKNIIFGHETIEAYENNPAFFGAVIGRVAGRISKGQMMINQKEYQVPVRDRGNTLHGGLSGFDEKIWQVKEAGQSLILTLTSEHMDQGFPGEVNVTVTYTLTDDNSLEMEYKAKTTEDTYVNLTNHAYFNLSDETTILNHELQVQSDYLLELDDSSIPTGQLLSVDQTPFDFRIAKAIGRDMDSKHPQLLQGNGYDHPWCLTDGSQKASLYDPVSGRKMTMYSDQNALILYSYNFPINNHQQHMGLAVEFQNDPDGMHHDKLNSCLLKKDDIYKQKTIYQFSVE